MAVRSLLASPGYTAAIIAILSLGIGANSAIFTVLDRVVIRPLPFADPGRLAVVWEDFSAFGAPKQRVSPATFLDWQSRNRTFLALAAYSTSGGVVTGQGAPEQLAGIAATSNLLPMIGVNPLAGRTFSAGDETGQFAVISYRVWRSRLGGSALQPDTTLVMNGARYTVLGVMPPGFHFPDSRTDYWIPLAFSPAAATRRNSHYLHVLGRLRPDRTWADARADMDGVARQLEAEYPSTNARVGIKLTPLRDELLAGADLSLTILLAAASCVLLIACANVTNLVLVRGSRRQREIAVRMALGASRARIVREVLFEALVLAAAGAAGALLVARWSVPALEWLAPAALQTSTLLPDGRTILFTVALALVTGLTFGATPAALCSSAALAPGLASGGARVTAGNRRASHLLVAVEIAFALILLAAAGLLIETLVKLRAVDGGFRGDRIVTANITVPFPKYADAGVRKRFFQDVLAAVDSIPGVEAAGLASDLPYTSRGNTMSVEIEHRPHGVGVVQDALFRLVSATYLQTIGGRLVAGRLLADTDGEMATPVVVINEAFARQYFPAGGALGHRIDTGTGGGASRWLTIVGIVADIRERGPDLVSKPAVYVPFMQTAISFFQPSGIAVRTSVAPLSIVDDLRRAVRAIDPEQPVAEVRTMDQILADELSDRRQVLTLLGAFAGLAMLLAALGIYAVLSYAVARGRRDIGVRIAIGASPRVVVGEVLAQAGRLAAAGIAAGLVGAAATTRLLSSLLYGVSPLEPGVLGGAVAAIGGVALLAAYVPARRAAAVNPMDALRAE